MSFYPGDINLNNNLISVDTALENPTVIEQRIANLASKNLLVDTLFSDGGGPVNGGAVIYSQITKKHLFTSAIGERQPGDEYPVVYTEKPDAALAKVEDFGGKFAFSDESRRRNNAIDFDNDVAALANTITRKLNQRAIETLEEALKNTEDKIEYTDSVKWNTVSIDGAPEKITEPSKRPTAWLATAQALAEDLDMGIQYSKLLLNPRDYMNLQIIYGKDLNAILDSFNLEAFRSIHIPRGSGYLIDPKTVGFVKYEEPLTIKTWRDEHRRQTWVQGYAMPVMGVTNPYGVAKLTGIGPDH
ncbi:hypothetical protein FRC0028_00615 [Corynebacterium diphtheriae]|uniref:major capsid protein n=1 Tax=Corynebacterium diphtheriae TaxID=1717 RepID=UPI000B4B0DE6|nr:major capsid protein [Corynebacterium diphtheriae]OWN41385.1 hypothetical protein AY488_04900 [Corynebacterium belfantii]OWN26105.1 hypothetical protein AY486_00650 [Corynebacterium diphtheriae bv. mitis]CAB0683897.1 hypothetical protein FRC0028_00615 [Corynebacterium diphtheriae]CAB0683976.1 hypothetical protein FRC0081_00614 [Corynebacterium diphtheriae]CAB0739910.1 hypothetical protein FRC0134_00613 [Corynebacterium diphtheriae]